MKRIVCNEIAKGNTINITAYGLTGDEIRQIERLVKKLARKRKHEKRMRLIYDLTFDEQLKEELNKLETAVVTEVVMDKPKDKAGNTSRIKGITVPLTCGTGSDGSTVDLASEAKSILHSLSDSEKKKILEIFKTIHGMEVSRVNKILRFCKVAAGSSAVSNTETLFFT